MSDPDPLFHETDPRIQIQIQIQIQIKIKWIHNTVSNDAKYPSKYEYYTLTALMAAAGDNTFQAPSVPRTRHLKNDLQMKKKIIDTLNNSNTEFRENRKIN